MVIRPSDQDRGALFQIIECHVFCVDEPERAAPLAKRGGYFGYDKSVNKKNMVTLLEKLIICG